MFRLLRFAFILTLFAVFSVGISKAGTIVQFDGFSTGPFTSGSNNGFTITTPSGYIFGTGLGFPGNSAGVPAPDGTSAYTFSDGGNITFVSLDLSIGADGQTVPAVTVDGYSGASLVATDTFSVPSVGLTPETFDAVNLAGLNLTSLVVSISSDSSWSTELDNVTFNTGAPEPATISMLGAGLCALLVARRRRNEKAQRP